MKTYADKLQDPRWQKMRLQVMQRDGFRCVACEDDQATLNVHHLGYKKGLDPWEYDPIYLVTLCIGCHQSLERGSRKIIGNLLAVHSLNLHTKVFARICSRLCDAMQTVGAKNGLEMLCKAAEQKELDIKDPNPAEVNDQAQEVFLVARDSIVSDGI